DRGGEAIFELLQGHSAGSDFRAWQRGRARARPHGITPGAERMMAAQGSSRCISRAGLLNHENEVICGGLQQIGRPEWMLGQRGMATRFILRSRQTIPSEELNLTES